MKIAFSKKALDDYLELSKELKVKANKQFGLLIKNFRHPSIHAKKYDKSQDVWQGRINKNYRFFFTIKKDIIFIITISKHPK